MTAGDSWPRAWAYQRLFSISIACCCSGIHRLSLSASFCNKISPWWELKRSLICFSSYSGMCFVDDDDCFWAQEVQVYFEMNLTQVSQQFPLYCTLHLMASILYMTIGVNFYFHLRLLVDIRLWIARYYFISPTITTDYKL